MQSAIIYKGPSLLDGAPIVVVAVISNRNKKTGDMLQTYIMRADMDPRDANKSGADYSICGTCPHRGTPTDDPNAKQAKARSCYVLLGQGPLIVWRMLEKNGYPDATTAQDRRALGYGRMIRIGTYGDGAAVPLHVWQELTENARGFTAYSHQAKTQGAAYAPEIYMRSVETVEQAKEAWAQGERTFRVVSSASDIVAGSEILCPASKEAGKRTTCEACGLCAGASIKAKNIAIPAHGAGKGYAVAA